MVVKEVAMIGLGAAMAVGIFTIAKLLSPSQIIVNVPGGEARRLSYRRDIIDLDL